MPGRDRCKRPHKKPKPRCVGIRPRLRIIFEADKRGKIEIPDGVRWRAEVIEPPEKDSEDS
jgi:hypothetical protein